MALIAPLMRPTCSRPKYSGTRLPRTIVTRPLAKPNSSAKSSSANVPSASAKIVNEAGSPPSTTRPSVRDDTQRPKPR